jgi:tRNA(fMet)-specific endonuclease VapC
MARRLILDTGIVISIKRGKIAVHEVYSDEDDVAIAAVTIAELVYGAMLAGDPDRRLEWTQHAVAVAAALRVLPYTADTAVRHGELLASTRSAGAQRGPLDLLIAAHAVQTGRVIVTRDVAARSDALPGVRVVTV